VKHITKKRTIDIESEFIGKAVGPLQKKERKSDLTDEINQFLEEPITLESIKKIMIRMSGYRKEYPIEKVSIKIYTIDKREYLIYIKGFQGVWSSKWFLSNWFMAYLDGFRIKEVDRSMLKQKLAHAIRAWCDENPKHIINLENLLNER